MNEKKHNGINFGNHWRLIICVPFSFICIFVILFSSSCLLACLLACLLTSNYISVSNLCTNCIKIYKYVRHNALCENKVMNKLN